MAFGSFDKKRLEVVLVHPGFRAAFAMLLLGAHLVLFGAAGARFQLPFNRAPADPPAFVPPDADFHRGAPQSWNRLLVSRWDSQYYIGTLLRGYSACPPGDLRGKPLRPMLGRCSFHFYPGYSLLGAPFRALGLAGDHALLAVSLLASFLLLFLWTGPTLRSRLGLGTTYLSLLLFNAYTTGFTLTTVQTEPVTLLSALGSFLLFANQRFFWAAVVAGTAGAFRVTGSAVGLGLVVGLCAQAWLSTDEPLKKRVLRVVLLSPVAGWGQLAVFVYFAIRYHDPLLYVHSHAEEFAHGVSLWNAIWPEPRAVSRALSLGPREGVFTLCAGLFLGLGLRQALAGFSSSERWLWGGLLFFSIGISLLGSAGLNYAGMNRYLLLALPLFFAMAKVLAPRPAALLVWLAFSSWSYWNSDLCTYVGDRGSERHCGIFWIPP
ncbi:MAG: hypothetical protein U0263_24050 [Polyangiaceae bacterium]